MKRGRPSILIPVLSGVTVRGWRYNEVSIAIGPMHDSYTVIYISHAYGIDLQFQKDYLSQKCCKNPSVGQPHSHADVKFCTMGTGTGNINYINYSRD